MQSHVISTPLGNKENTLTLKMVLLIHSLILFNKEPIQYLKQWNLDLWSHQNTKMSIMQGNDEWHNLINIIQKMYLTFTCEIRYPGESSTTEIYIPINFLFGKIK